MRYNTAREELKIAEYGRNVQKMVAHIKTLPDKEERNKAANTVVNIMVTLNPALKEQSEYKHKLWDHLFMMADYDLDVDSPFDKPVPEEALLKPNKPAYSSNHIKYRYYGKNVELMIKKAEDMEDGPAKSSFVNALASYMKMAHRVWNEDKVPDEIIIQHITDYSKGAIVVTEINEFAAHNENFNPKPKRDNYPSSTDNQK
jgi:molybdopterin converting factor small subunit